MAVAIRYARREDAEAVQRLLSQILRQHHARRPDIFRSDARKYSIDDFYAMLEDENRPIFVAENDGDVLGYAFCAVQLTQGNTVRHDARVLYLDDLCVDESAQAQGIGRLLFDECLSLARAIGAVRLELTVWEDNADAVRFYERRGMTTQRRVMEINI